MLLAFSTLGGNPDGGGRWLSECGLVASSTLCGVPDGEVDGSPSAVWSLCQRCVKIQTAGSMAIHVRVGCPHVVYTQDGKVDDFV